MTEHFKSVGDIAQSIVRGMAGERVWDGKPIVEPGVYSAVDIDRYHRDTSLFADDGFSISSTGIRQILDRPISYWFTSPFNPDVQESETKKELDFGKAAHMLLLGERGFAERYALRPRDYENDKGEWKPWNGNATVCKLWLRKQAEAGKTVITETEIEHIRGMADALQRKEAVRLGILNGRVERSIFWRETVAEPHVWLKARPDVLPNSSGDFVDLKTAARVDDESLSKAVFDHGYYVQAGLLRMVVREVLGPDAFTSFTFVFVEKQPPFDVRIMQLKDGDIDLGERQARRGVAILRECLKAGEWPGYDGPDQHISFLEMPSWAKTRLETTLAAEAA